MNPLAKRRAQISPAEQRQAQEEARRRIALAVSIAERKAKEETQQEVLEALSAIKGQ
ncbi:hypothetical protein [Mesorhizobium sp. M2D.F.Ca.ET.223.01.1.1]|uniref:hypothetical protein n=1 Tax=Mesorhizobium sp. M2D.F.Ca.ET.223.01.1.1 TaxID=2563940 RepID=UPI00142EA3F1|nr:hypothetical protein [Mesorhizobium sp. M2D.F.Ca.ET.223.01.1.1]